MVRQWILTIVRYDFIHDIYNDFKSCVATICMDLHTRARARESQTQKMTLLLIHTTHKNVTIIHTHTYTKMPQHNTCIHTCVHKYRYTNAFALAAYKTNKTKEKKKHRGEKAREN